MFKLVIQDDEGKTTIVPLIRDEITIGRKEGNTIRLTERNVSRRHARILRNNGEVQIEDLGSYNGIRVNNARIAERVSLRVSDQVQIGDYKLYLKAEGVEQVDEARTMPIERLEAVAATDQIAAVAAPQTAPMAAVATPPQIVGSPNRTLVAIADTDPQGRPVATAAAVAALTAPVGYGKLVVLSSNFAGKEFELSRPQMIIGRTDENDIVVNHRSISRNHAKLVREPESGRYTISDLQSSNGVRVNGQDYGKVELRRGDVIDLGHVRLRFIEPGEDFVFSRDAVITDVPDAGGKRGLLVAVVLAILVLGAVGVFFLVKNNEGKTNGNDVVQPGSDPQGSSNVVDATPQVATNPPPATPDAPPVGSDHQAGTPSSNDIEAECALAKADKKWSDLHSCGERLQSSNPAKGKEFLETASSETQASIADVDLRRALDDGNLREAKKLLDKIKNGSAYRQAALDKYNAAEQKAQDEEVGRVNRLVAKNDCKGAQAAAKQASSRSEQIGQAASAVANRCVPATAVQPNPPPQNTEEQLRKEVEQATAQANKLLNKSPPDCQGLKTLLQSATKDQVADAIRPIANRCKVAAPTECDADDFKNKGTNSFSMGQFAASLGFFEQALACKPSVDLVKLAYTAACNARNSTKAKLYFARLSSQVQKDVQVICIRNMIQVP